MQEIVFCQHVESDYRSQVERLFFFNSEQSRRSREIEDAVERYGEPRLIIENGLIHMGLSKTENCSTLFGLYSLDESGVVLGLVIFSRPSIAVVEMIHIAVLEDCSMRGHLSGEFVTMRLVGRLIEDCRKLKNVETLVLPYSSRTLQIRQQEMMWKAGY